MSLPPHPHLPLELYLLIVAFPYDLSTLKSLSLTCRHFRNELRPRLFGAITYHVDNDDEHAGRLPELLNVLPTISQYINRLRLSYDLDVDPKALVGENENGEMLQDVGKISRWLGPWITILELFGMGYPEQLQPITYSNLFPNIVALSINDAHPFNLVWLIAMLIDMPELRHLRIVAWSYELVDFEDWSDYDFAQSPALQTIELGPATAFQPILEWIQDTPALRSLIKLTVTINDMGEFQELTRLFARESALKELDLTFGLLEPVDVQLAISDQCPSERVFAS
jgi:hypothetical protein